MASSTPVSVLTLDGRKVLRLPCHFAGTKIERASWDRKVKLDLGSCQGVQFKLLCRDASPVSCFSLYFQSGEGWYHATFFPESATGWNTVSIDKSAVTTEGNPAGWSQITALRLSAWRGNDADTEFYLADLRCTGVLGGDVSVATLLGLGITAKQAVTGQGPRTPPRTGLIYDAIYLKHDTGAGHPERAERLVAIRERLERTGLLPQLALIKPRVASEESLATIHNPPYIDHVRQICQAGTGYIDSPDTPASPDSYAVALLAVGGVQSAIDAVMEGFTLNVPLPAGSGDAEYLKAFEERLKPAAAAFQPDFVLISAGFDAAKDDLLGRMNLTPRGYAQLTRIVKTIAQQYCRGRLVSVLEGGYHLEALAASVEAHLRVLME